MPFSESVKKIVEIRNLNFMNKMNYEKLINSKRKKKTTTDTFGFIFQK